MSEADLGDIGVPSGSCPFASSLDDEEPLLSTGRRDSEVKDQLKRVAQIRKERGNRYVTNQKWEQAVSEFTVALKYLQDKDEEPPLLAARSAALAAWVRHLRSIPAAASESRALYGHDPTHLAQLALKDAQKANQLRPTWHDTYCHQGDALFLLERFSEAETSYLEGLALNPKDDALLRGLEQVQGVLADDEEERSSRQRATPSPPPQPGAASTAAARPQAADAVAADAPGAGGAKRRRRVTRPDADDAECILCMKLLFEPVTTPCGHSFCRCCFARSMDHSNRCPMCRTVVHVGRTLPVSVTLSNLLRKAFPEETLEREAEAAALAPMAGDGGSFSLPLFVMTALLPGETMALNIFEPRYRLMVRRCMEGNRRLGMAQVDAGHDLLPAACEAEITECQPQPDGRYYLEVTGIRRITITRCWDQDGYRVAAVQPLTDEPPPGAPDAAALHALASEVEALADHWVGRVQGMVARGGVGQRMTALLERIGGKPPGGAAQPEALSFWVGRLLLVSPMGREQGLRAQLLAGRDTAARLRQQQAMLARRGVGAGGCAMM